MSELDKLERLVKEEKEAFDKARAEVKAADERSAVHYYRLGLALIEAKEILGKGLGKPGKFRAWHSNLGLNKDLVSRAMRLAAAVSEDGGEETLAGLGWWAALKEYEIVSDKPKEQPVARAAMDFGGGREGGFGCREAATSSGYREGYTEQNEGPPTTSAITAKVAETAKEPQFSDLQHIGWGQFLRRHLEALGAPRSEVEDLVAQHATDLDLRLRTTLRHYLEEILNEYEGVTSKPEVFEGEPF